MCLIACSHRRHGQDKTRLSCLVCVGGVNTIEDKTRQFCLVSTQFLISKFHQKLSCLVANSVDTADMDKTKLAHVGGGVNQL